MGSDSEVHSWDTNVRSVWVDGKSDIDLGALRRLVAAAESLPDTAAVTVDKRWGSNADRTSCWFKRIEVTHSDGVKPEPTSKRTVEQIESTPPDD